MPKFKVGDSVRWMRLGDAKKTYAGIVVSIIPGDSRNDDFTLYDIKFEHGMFTVYGANLDAGRAAVSPRR